MGSPFVVWNALKCEHGNGSWAVIDGSLTVTTATGCKSTQLGGSTPEVLAKVMSRELAQEE